MNLIKQGLKRELIKFDAEQKRITYVHQNKSRNDIIETGNESWRLKNRA